jgi:hypothetical protein
MRLDTRPLLDTGPDAKLFIDREMELEQLLRAVAADLNFLIVGERGIGKTSLLRHAAYRLQEGGEPVAVVDAGLADSVEGVLLTIEGALGRAPHSGELLQAGFQRALNPPRAPGSRAVDLVRRLAAGARAIVMLDNLPSPEVGHTLFGRLRDELWQLPHTWVVTASPADLRMLLAPPADAFFALKRELQPLTEPAAKQLLMRRLGRGQTRVATDLARTGEGNPRKLLELARHTVLDDAGPDAAYDLLERRGRAQLAADGLGRSHGMLFAELLAAGRASPSDQGLLERMGWSRSRANQVLRDLQREGLAMARDEVPDGAGKPRRVYTPAFDGEGL